MSTGTDKGVFRMPSLGADMESGTLIEWCKQPGDAFKKGDVIAVVETQKGAIEVEVFQDGILGRILVAPGETVPVGTAMAELEAAGAEAETPQPASPPEAGQASGTAGILPAPAQAVILTAVPAAASPQPGAMPAQSAPGRETEARPQRRRASPAARRLAQERGIDLSALTGSGPLGAITLADVRSATAKAPQPKPTGEHPAGRGRLDLVAMREAIAAAMSRSKREIPHYYLAHDIDLTPAADWLARRNAELPPQQRILIGVLFIKAVALTLRDFPELNGFDRDGRFEPGPGIHVGTATAIRGGGLVAPAIHDADRLDLQTLSNGAKII